MRDRIHLFFFFSFLLIDPPQFFPGLVKWRVDGIVHPWNINEPDQAIAVHLYLYETASTTASAEI